MIDDCKSAEKQLNLKLVPLTKWEKHFDYPTLGTLRYLNSKRNENGFHKCVSMIHGRVYLDVKKTFEFLSKGTK